MPVFTLPVPDFHDTGLHFLHLYLPTPSLSEPNHLNRCHRRLITFITMFSARTFFCLLQGICG